MASLAYFAAGVGTTLLVIGVLVAIFAGRRNAELDEPTVHFDAKVR